MDVSVKLKNILVELIGSIYLFKMHINFNSVLLLGTCLLEIFVFLLKDISTRLFTAALFALGENLEQPKWLYNAVRFNSFYFLDVELCRNGYVLI